MPANRRTSASPADSRRRTARVQGKATKPLVTPQTVEKRARELARIAGRGANRVTESDRRQAKRELLGPVHPTSTARDESSIPAGQWDPAPTSTGRRTPRAMPRDDQTTKELVEEGVDEAEHDQMLKARKSHK